jgi:hypothetical protein
MFVSSVSKGFTLVGSEGPASVSNCCFEASAPKASVDTSEVSTVFFGVMLEYLIVSKTSNTLTILFLLGVTLDLSAPKLLMFLLFQSLVLPIFLLLALWPAL